MIKHIRKRFLFLPVLVILILSNLLSYGVQKITVNNQTDYYISVADLEVGNFGEGVKNQNPSKLTNLKPRQEGIFEDYPRGDLGIENDAINVHDMNVHAGLLEIRKSPNDQPIKTLSFRLKGYEATTPNAYVTKDKNGIETQIKFSVKITPMNRREFTKLRSNSLVTYYDYIVTITQAQTMIAPESGLVDPVGVPDDNIDYKDVLVSFKNESNYDLSITLGSQSPINLSKESSLVDIHLNSTAKNPMTEPIVMYIKPEGAAKAAEFSKEKNTISRNIRSFIPSQAEAARTEQAPYLVKLGVTPKYSKAPNEKLWKVKYDIVIKVE